MFENEMVVTLRLRRDNETVSVTVTDAVSGEQRTEDYRDDKTVVHIYALMEALLIVLESAPA